MNSILRYILQGINYSVFMGMVWYFSIMPPYSQLSDDQAVVTLAFAHAGKLREPCRQLTQEELSRLAPNMRLSMSCPRERSPVTVELYVDDKLITHAVIDPPGFHSDQGIDLFHSVKVAAGEHHLKVWMNDNVNVDGPTYQYESTVTLKPEQLLLVDFNANAGGFYIN